jgi:predicted AlkP superfamily pyrophosphatase or phosphodiesterase
MDPSFLDKYNGKEPLPSKVNRILEFLDMPGLENPEVDIRQSRPQIIAAYVPNVDADGHNYGPNSTEIRTTISEVDAMLDDLFHGLERRNLTDIVNVIIVSDHGMATTDVSRMIQIEDLVDIAKVEHLDGWPLVGIRPKKPEDLQVLYQQVAEKAKSNPNFDVYLKDKDMPERFHFSNNDRIAPLWIVPKTGWAIVEKAEFDIQDAKANNISYHPRGLHGYDHEHPLMRAIFVARGPAFPHQPHSKVETFRKLLPQRIVQLSPRP